MAKQAVVDAVRARLSANFTSCAILSLNQDVLPPADGSPWVRLEFPVASNTQTILGRRYRESGAFRVVIATEILSGETKSLTYCEEIATIFRNQKFNDVDCRTPTIREGLDDGSYFIASVIVPYTHDYDD